MGTLTSGHSRSTRGQRWLLPLLLVMLGARAAVPAGFMLSPVEGRLDLVICDADAASALRHHGHEHDGHHHAQSDPTCPYAQSAGPAPLPALAALPAAPVASERVQPVLAAQLHARFGPQRQQTSRGPPTLT